jgi:8-oxo-dGTP diphosphatase
MEPRIRVSAILRRESRVLLVRHEKGGREYWLLPGGGVGGGETLLNAVKRELAEELGLDEDLPLEGPVALADSISPPGWPPKHVVHIVFAGYLGDRSLERVTSGDPAVRNHRLFDVEELAGLAVHPPIQRFLSRWQPGDPTVYLGSLWAP